MTTPNIIRLLKSVKNLRYQNSFPSRQYIIIRMKIVVKKIDTLVIIIIIIIIITYLIKLLIVNNLNLFFDFAIDKVSKRI